MIGARYPYIGGGAKGHTWWKAAKRTRLERANHRDVCVCECGKRGSRAELAAHIPDSNGVVRSVRHGEASS